jgi:hypothetical protein
MFKTASRLSMERNHLVNLCNHSLAGANLLTPVGAVQCKKRKARARGSGLPKPVKTSTSFEFRYAGSAIVGIGHRRFRKYANKTGAAPLLARRVTISAGARNRAGEQKIRWFALDRRLRHSNVAQQIRSIGVDQRMIGRPAGAIQIDRCLLHTLELPQDFGTISSGCPGKRRQLA